MKSRICTLSIVCFALVTLFVTNANAYSSEAPTGQFDTHTSSSSFSIPVNDIFAFIVIGAAVLGLIAVKNAKMAINAKLKSQRQQGY